MLAVVFIFVAIFTFAYESMEMQKPAAVPGSMNASGKGSIVRFSGRPGAVFNVEIANTPDERSYGLMNRTYLPPDSGMLFVFDDVANEAFWMKDTLIPLDMIFIDQTGRVLNVYENATPLSETPINSAGPCKFVLEINGGTCDKYGIRAGDQVLFE